MRKASQEILRVFATKNFMRFAKKFRCSERELWEAVQMLPDTDLGGGVFKFRLARAGEGTSGGARAIVAMRIGKRVVLMYGYEKKDQANISRDELRDFRASAKLYLGFSEEQMSALVKRETLTEVTQRNKKPK